MQQDLIPKVKRRAEDVIQTEDLPVTHEVLGLIPRTTGRKGEGRREGGGGSQSLWVRVSYYVLDY